MRNDASRLINLGEQHQAVGPTTFDPPHMVIGRAQPVRRLDEHGRAPRIGHTAVSGVGT